MIFAKDTICTGESMSGEDFGPFVSEKNSESKDPEDQWQQGARHLGPPAGREDSRRDDRME